jgi:hypothetical protein
MISIPLGVLITMVAAQVYSLPSKRAKLYTNTAAVTFLQSNDSTFASSSAVTLVEGAYEVDAAFITSDIDALVILKEY